MTTFADLGLPTPLVTRLEARGITEAFPIQEASIPDALEGRDIVGKAATGSGKTLAFGLPLLARLEKARPRKPTALILVPTRELAAQVHKELAQLTQDRGKRILSVYGGTSYNVARKNLNFGVDVVVACPGRLEDLLEQGALDLKSTMTVVVDEADRMADMGFLQAVRRIVGATNPNRHVMLFSATMGPDVELLVNEFTEDAVRHDVVGEEPPSDTDHYFWKVPRDERPDSCAQIISENGAAIVFCRTKHGADRLAKQLGDRGLSAASLHGDKTQAQRDRAIRAIKQGDVDALVATDVAARGIHVDDLPVVIHYDPPAQASDYLHRSGRTGRAGAKGMVVSIVADNLVGQVTRLQKALGMAVGTIGEPGEAPAVRLGVVDEAAAAERVDDRPTKHAKAAAKPTSVKQFERPTKRPRAEHADREERGDRPERRERFDRGERPERRERFDGGERRERFDRTERPERRERFDRDERPRRDTAERGEWGQRPRAPRGENDRPQREWNNDERPPRERSPREWVERGQRHDDRRHHRDVDPRGRVRDGRRATVTFFDAKKGFGFAHDGNGDDLFIHFSNIVTDGFRTLYEGQTIMFDEARGPKGREATNVRPMGGGQTPGHHRPRKPRR